MNNKKWYILTVLFLLGALFLSACGGAEEPAAEETAEEPATTETTEEEAAPAEEEAAPVEEAAPTEEAAPVEEAAPTEEAAPVEEAAEEASTPEISITIWADDTRAPILLELAEAFQAEYGVALVVEQVADIRDQFVIAAPAGEGPDIILGAHDWLGQLVDSGLLAPLDLGDKADSFVDVALTGFTFDGQLYGMPYATENLGFFYNTDLVAEAPTTWAEVMEVGGALQADGKVTYAMGLTGTTYDAFPIQTAFGGYVFGIDANGNYDPSDVGIDSEGMIAAGDFLQQAVVDGLISDSTDWDTNHVLFESGEVPFLMAGPWALDRFRAAGVPYAITNFPDGGRPFAGVQGFMVNALSENVLLAQAFLTEFVATDEVMTELYLSGNRPSAFASVLAATDDPDLAAFGEAGANAVLMPAIPEMGSVWSSWGDAFTLILTQEQTAEEALTTGAAQIRDLIGGAALGMINVPGSWQAASGACPGDWDPACEGSALTDNGDGTYSGTFDLAAGDYEVKVALDGAWTVNYGVDGEADGANYMFTMPADGTVTFTFDSATNLLTIETN
ncbi:MAG: extracellular solute-binding protein [Ardenticatenaceae bacterium]|nr:extracellular solute-binding protein [Anaerolineales bacterium]MCB8939079.1 extracellular solute-binding protein [Ardenticatenaceae bacterium]MCB8974835.1 extracellular solute-binding protein [Ardenticatenaceae bacterium]